MSEPFVPVSYQYFTSKQDWIHNAQYALTGHADYNNTESVAAGAKSGWQGHHFTALCFDQKGRRCLTGADFQRAEDDGSYPIWWVWPDQIAELLMAASSKGQIEEAQRADTDGAEQPGSSLTQKFEDPSSDEVEFSKVMP